MLIPKVRDIINILVKFKQSVFKLMKEQKIRTDAKANRDLTSNIMKITL